MILINKINNHLIYAERAHADEGGRVIKDFLDGIPATATEPGKQANPAEMSTTEVTDLLGALN